MTWSNGSSGTRLLVLQLARKSRVTASLGESFQQLPAQPSGKRSSSSAGKLRAKPLRVNVDPFALMFSSSDESPLKPGAPLYKSTGVY